MDSVYHKKMAKRYTIGIDEVGRGPLAGPVTVCAVALRDQGQGSRVKFLKNIKDSKKLTPEKRLEWYKKLTAYGIQHSVSFVGPAIIDKIGMSAATRLAVGRCLAKLKIKNKKSKIQTQNYKILLDGSLYAPKTYLNQETIIKGDEKIPLIAAASIIAKVKRDKHMIKMHKIFPKYGFAFHKGYGTKFHQEAIKAHGLCAIHRKSFCRKFI